MMKTEYKLLFKSHSFDLRFRMVPTFATTHTFCASCDGLTLRKFGFLTVVPAKTGIFLCGLMH